MTRNEYIASIMLEAAELLREDNEQQESLNETGLDLVGGLISLVWLIGGTAIIYHKQKKQNLLKEEENKRIAEENKRIAEEKYQEKMNNNTYYLSIAKKEITISNKKQLRELVLKDIRTIVNLYKKDPKIQKKIKKDLQELKDSGDYDIEHGDVPLYNGLHVDDCGDYIEIIDGDQEVRMALSWICYDIAEVLNYKWKQVQSDFKTGNFDAGDGDEGCIYFDNM